MYLKPFFENILLKNFKQCVELSLRETKELAPFEAKAHIQYPKSLGHTTTRHTITVGFAE